MEKLTKVTTVIEDLANEWRTAGVEEGDILLVHSSIKRTFRRYLKQGKKVTPQLILESLIESVGTSGTLLLPLYNFGFASGEPFDIRNTPSKMGALTEAARLHPSSVRTGHPIYSFSVIGHCADQFRGINNFSGYGGDSPFALLRKLGGKIAVLDLADQDSMTFYHYIEEMNEVDYRYHKTFTGEYTDALGNRESRTYGLFVRDLERNVETHVNPTGELLWKDGLYSGFRPNDRCGLRTINAQKMYDYVSDVIISGNAKNNLYRIARDEHE